MEKCGLVGSTGREDLSKSDSSEGDATHVVRRSLLTPEPQEASVETEVTDAHWGTDKLPEKHQKHLGNHKTNKCKNKLNF